ncbi:GNAT family N-acetyltransferase [Protofrankia sp. BMG5.30]|uniref:GNAT family N-acetyltransferase n=3 Tax=Protofrankia TaxID=2994361 RepID=UPI0009774715|nr:GNAT family N-acetyltransferase [Protofrankia sp. BMG5.30]ONH34101.1 GNAT family N-acetyltransferase [Protofrankia sp. BMG5.30]
MAAEPVGDPGQPAAAPDALVAPTVGEPVDNDLSRELEDLAHRAWPPLRERRLGGWVLRESAGSSRRGNSVWARGDVGDIAGALNAVGEFYATAGLPPTLQITPVSLPADIHEALDVAGFDDTGPTDVCVADLEEIRERLAAGPTGHVPVGAGGSPPAGADGHRAILLDTVGDVWLDVAGQVLATFAGQRAGTLGVLANLTVPAAYVLCVLDGVPVAVGRGTVDGDWLGIYSMATVPAARGRGAARAVLTRLAAWAAEAGASRAYLQVEQTSTAARQLYAALGFRPVYRYSYRRLHTAATPGASG